MELSHPSTAPIVFNLLNTYGCTDAMVFFSRLIGDNERVVSHYVTRGAYARAAGALCCHNRGDGHVVHDISRGNLVYKFAPTLMENAPSDCVNVLASMDSLRPVSLIPALVHYEHCQRKYHPFANAKASRRKPTNWALTYLEHCTTRHWSSEQVLHNFLLSLYVTNGDTKSTMAYLKRQLAAERPQTIDLGRVFRACWRQNETMACIYIYTAMDLLAEAVDLALGKNIPAHAVIEVEKSRDSLVPVAEDARQKLWLRILRHYIARGNVSAAIRLPDISWGRVYPSAVVATRHFAARSP